MGRPSQAIGTGGRFYGFHLAALALVPADCALIAFCDQDDEWEPDKLQILVRYFADPAMMAVHSDLSLIDRNGAQIGESCWRAEACDVLAEPSLARLIFRNSVTGRAMMFRADVLKSALATANQWGSD